jgi:hypothetical protein
MCPFHRTYKHTPSTLDSYAPPLKRGTKNKHAMGSKHSEESVFELCMSQNRSFVPCLPAGRLRITKSSDLENYDNPFCGLRACRRRKYKMGNQLIYQDQGSYNERYTGNFVEAMYQFNRYFVAQFIGVKSFGGIHSKLHNEYGCKHNGNFK